jgi:hypothetical protein
MFKDIPAPRQTRLSRHAIRSFEKEPERFLAPIKEHRSRAGGEALYPVSVISAIDRKVLTNLCQFEKLCPGTGQS